MITRQSHTGIIIYINNSPITWFRKWQNTVEASSFGYDFIAIKISTKMNEGLRYNFRMFRVPVDGPAEFFCDDKSVVINSGVPESDFSKKHNSICYHGVR